MDNNYQSPSPDLIVSLGESIYFEKKDELEKENLGKFAVIEVESKDIFISDDKLEAVQQAQVKHPDKLFYIVQIGKINSPSSIGEIRAYGWNPQR